MEEFVSEYPPELGCAAIEKNPSFAQERAPVDRAAPVAKPPRDVNADGRPASRRQAPEPRRSRSLERGIAEQQKSQI